MADELTSADLIHDALVRHQVFLLRFASQLKTAVNTPLNWSEELIRDMILGRIGRARSLESMNKLVGLIINTRAEAWAESTALWRDELRALAVQEGAWILDALKRTIPLEIAPLGISTKVANSIVNGAMVNGRTVMEWAADARRADADMIRTSVRMSATAGAAPRLAVRALMGTQAAAGADGLLQRTRNNVAAISRSAVVGISDAVRSETFELNPDIVEQEVFTAVLDGRTTPICRSLDSKRYDIGEGPHPPLHMNCRSIRVPTLNGETIGNRNATPIFMRRILKDFTSENGLAAVTKRADLPHGTKGAFDAFRRARAMQVVGKEAVATSYETFLRRQPATFQDDVLGVTKGKLFRQGGLGLDAFVDRNTYQPVTLARLAQSDAAAFKAAGLDPEDFR